MGKSSNKMSLKPSISYVINDKLGGITSLNIALAKAGQKQTKIEQHFAFYHYKQSVGSRFNTIVQEANKQTMLEYSKLDNIYFVFKKFKKQLPPGAGVLVSNDIFELHYIESFGTEKTVYQIVHDDYNLELSQKFEPYIDVFIAHSLYIYNNLIKTLPNRHESCFYLPYGIEIPEAAEKAKLNADTLNLMFLGRMTTEKGIFDLPEIDKLLKERKISVNWTVIGRGPEKQKLFDIWKKFNQEVVFISPDTKEELNQIINEQDVFVFPTRFEGFPVALLETMALGVVPIVSDIPSGIPELVTPENGFLVHKQDIKGFVEKIQFLDGNRNILKDKALNSKEFVASNYELNNNMAAYHQLFAQYKELKQENNSIQHIQFGSRLDKWYLPNFIVRIIRKFIYKI
ncbi:glycosyltransferase family 4 protein [Winogradskyella sp.]|nr:glycosyltransferase family 4 protein [Winogradskyella sp.]